MDRAKSEAGDKLVNAEDRDARQGTHWHFYSGSLIHVAMDAESEIIAALNVLPANGVEAEDAVTLIRPEEAAQGNDVQGLSMDGAGYDGSVLHELTEPQGLNLDVTMPLPYPNELAWHHPCRRACFRGRPKVQCANPADRAGRQRKRIVNLLACSALPEIPTPAVRALPTGG